MIKIDCCGYPISAKRYQENFCVVKLNKMGYRYPRLPTVIGWRKKAPKDFESTVKAHQDVSHRFKLKIECSVNVFDKMQRMRFFGCVKELLTSHSKTSKP